MAVKENRAFSEMLAVAQSRLVGRSPLQIAEKAHVTFDQEQQAYYHLGQRLLPPGCPGCWPDRTAH